MAIDFRPIGREDLAGIIALCQAEPWPCYTESEPGRR